MVVASIDEARVARCRHSWECHLKTVYELEEVMRRMGRQAQGSENQQGIPEARDEHIRSYVIYRGRSTLETESVLIQRHAQPLRAAGTAKLEVHQP